MSGRTEIERCRLGGIEVDDEYIEVHLLGPLLGQSGRRREIGHRVEGDALAFLGAARLGDRRVPRRDRGFLGHETAPGYPLRETNGVGHLDPVIPAPVGRIFQHAAPGTPLPAGQRIPAPTPPIHRSRDRRRSRIRPRAAHVGPAPAQTAVQPVPSAAGRRSDGPDGLPGRVVQHWNGYTGVVDGEVMGGLDTAAGSSAGAPRQ